MQTPYIINTARRELFNLFCKNQPELFYIVEKKKWSINWDGKYITDSLNRQHLLSAQSGFSRDARLSKNRILHFGSRNLFLPEAYKRIHSSNHIIFTWFHGTDEDTAFINALPKCVGSVDTVHTSCNISRNNLIRWGIPEEKIVVIPLGVDLDLFRPVAEDEKQQRREALNIPAGKLVIGSFQKDGNGWDEGLEPKLIKGPDIFCDTCIRINREHPVHALLTGPARGYVKQRLKAAGITYTHVYFDDFTQVAPCYPAADLCLITSRAEGGPKALLEGMASGIPVVSTRMGMPADLLHNKENGMLSDIDDTQSLADHCLALAGDPVLQQTVSRNALREIQAYSWDQIAQRYFNEIYWPALNNI